MPGHKGNSCLGFEKYDLTEVFGADSLYSAEGIIKKSEENASALFGSGKTLYSTEGSSQCIKAMIHLAKVYTGSSLIIASRNAHSAFISACALNDCEVEWLSTVSDSYLSCVITPSELENTLSRVDKSPACVYITSPDYLGNMCDVKALSQVCHKHGTLLLVDNAHGAYLKFLKEDMHPLTLGADLCCDSAHKTLPVLTGGAYLHVSKSAPDKISERAKGAMALFGSTSPSYLILQSLDRANAYLADGYGEKIEKITSKIAELFGENAPLHEKMKIVIKAKELGYTGTQMGEALAERGIMCEFCDQDYLVLMPTPENVEGDLVFLKNTIDSLPKKDEITDTPPRVLPPNRVMSIREATFAPRERVAIENALGRTLATANITCPPAVSIAVSGEEINESVISACRYYGVTECFCVVDKK